MARLGRSIHGPVLYPDFIVGGTADNTTPMVEALAMCEAVGGTIVMPPGVVTFTPVGITVPAKTTIVGSAHRGTVLKKLSNGRLFDIAGDHTTAVGPNFVGQLRGVVFRDLTFSGNNLTGDVHRIMYGQYIDFENCRWEFNNGCAINAIQWWDSTLTKPVIDHCGNVATSEPAVWLRKEFAASGEGSSEDNCNHIKFVDSQWHENAHKDLVIDSRTFEGAITSQRCCHIGLEGRTKFESTGGAKNGPFVECISVDDFGWDDVFTNLLATSDAVPVPHIKLTGCDTPMGRQIRAASRAAGTRSVVQLTGTGDNASLGRVICNYDSTFKPTEGIVEFAAATAQTNLTGAADFIFGNGSAGLEWGGINPSSWRNDPDWTRAGVAPAWDPESPVGGSTAKTVVAGTADIMRRRFRRPHRISSIRLKLKTAAAANDAIHVAVYDSGLTTRLASSGAVSGKLNGATGTIDIALTAPLWVNPGVTYQFAVLVPANGGAAATLAALSLPDAMLYQSVGTTGGLQDFATATGLATLPAGTVTPAAPASTTAAMWIVEG